MAWIEKRKEERANIHKYYPEAKSVISIAINYFTGNSKDKFEKHKISNYAWGDDYHIIIKNKLHLLLKYIKSLNSNINGICCVDTSPVSEKIWAQRAGIGWIGKHTNLITREFGSWVFLGELIVDSELEYDDLQKALEAWLNQENDVKEGEISDPAKAADSKKNGQVTEDVSSAFDDLFNS